MVPHDSADFPFQGQCPTTSIEFHLESPIHQFKHFEQSARLKSSTNSDTGAISRFKPNLHSSLQPLKLRTSSHRPISHLPPMRNTSSHQPVSSLRPLRAIGRSNRFQPFEQQGNIHPPTSSNTSTQTSSDTSSRRPISDHSYPHLNHALRAISRSKIFHQFKHFEQLATPY